MWVSTTLRTEAAVAAPAAEGHPSQVSLINPDGHYRAQGERIVNTGRKLARAVYVPLWVAGALHLFGCGGGNAKEDAGLVAAPPPSNPVAEEIDCSDSSVSRPEGCPPTIIDARLESVTAIETAIENAVVEGVTSSKPVSVSAIPHNMIGDAGVTVTGVALTIEDLSGELLELDSEQHSVTEPLKRFPLPRSPISIFDPLRSHGHEFSEWTLFDYATEGTSVAHATVSWNWQNPDDYLSGGYWMRLRGDVGLGDIAEADVGAFIDGPELSGGRASFPDTGTAVY